MFLALYHEIKELWPSKYHFWEVHFCRNRYLKSDIGEVRVFLSSIQPKFIPTASIFTSMATLFAKFRYFEKGYKIYDHGKERKLHEPKCAAAWFHSLAKSYSLQVVDKSCYSNVSIFVLIFGLRNASRRSLETSKWRGATAGFDRSTAELVWGQWT